MGAGQTVNGMTLGAFTGYFRNRESRKNVLFPYGSYFKHYVFGIIYTRSDIYNIEAYLKTVNVVLSKPIKKLLITYINDCTEENWEEFILKVNLKQNSVLVKRPTIDDMLITETDIYNINNYQKISSVVRDFDYFLQEKWKIAIDRPGSGNTKNIGSVSNIEILKSGTGLFYSQFEDRGIEVFDSYWCNYQTKDMAKVEGKDKPSYSNIESYKDWVESIKK